jgi:hypothetical protein
VGDNTGRPAAARNARERTSVRPKADIIQSRALVKVSAGDAGGAGAACLVAARRAQSSRVTTRSDRVLCVSCGAQTHTCTAQHSCFVCVCVCVWLEPMHTSCGTPCMIACACAPSRKSATHWPWPCRARRRRGRSCLGGPPPSGSRCRRTRARSTCGARMVCGGGAS